MSQLAAVQGLNGAQRTRQALLQNRSTNQEVSFKAGPQKSDVEEYDEDGATKMSSMVTAISHNLRSGQSINAGVSYSNLTTTRELVTTIAGTSLNQSNSNNVSTQSVKTRVSVATSAYHKRVNYLAGGVTAAEPFQWGTFDTPVTAASAFAQTLHGYNGNYPYPLVVPGGGGAPAPAVTRAYSSSQLANETKRLVENLEVVDGVMVDVRHVMVQACLNFQRAVLVNDVDFRDGQATWQSRPTAPTDLVNGGQSLNLYSAKGAQICAGQYLPIELEESEVHLIDGLTFLLGTRRDTINIPMGNHAGNNRVAHINQKEGPSFDFGFVILGNLSQMPRAAYGTPAWGGMPALNIVAGSNCLPFSLQYLGVCMDVLARSLPMAGQLEAAGLRVMGAAFAENYHGVAGATNRCGSDAAHSGYNYCFDSGDIYIGGGSLSCAIGTRVPGRGAVTDAARRRMGHLVTCMSSVANIRAVTIQLAVIFQFTCRQMGADARVMFPGLPAGNVVNNDAAAEASIDSDLALHAMMFTPADGFPSCWGDMSNLMARELFGYEIVLSFRFYGFGDTSDGATPPLAGLMNVGEVYTCVHSAEVYPGRFKSGAVGLAGFPSQLGMLVKLLTIRTNYTSEGTVVASAVNSAVGEGDQMVWNGGSGQLGHASVLTLDSQIQNTDTYRIELSNVRNEVNRNEVTAADVVTLSLTHVQAFCNATAVGWGVMNIAYRHMPLFTDFSMRSRQNLGLRLPSRAATMMAGNPNVTAMVPGYFEASIRAGLDNVAGHFGVYQAPMGRRVRQRVTPTVPTTTAAAAAAAALAAAAARNANEGGGEDGGGDHQQLDGGS